MSCVYVVSLGCDKNRVDGEVMIGCLRNAGYEVVDSPKQAQAIVVNTCGFIKDAVQESIELILELAEYKKTHICEFLIVVGCMAQRYREEIFTEIPEIDEVMGVGEYEKIVEIVGARLAARLDASATVNPRLAARTDAKHPHIAHVKIAEGCDTNCTYCTIPSIRGPYKSRPMEEIIAECSSLVESGAKELVLVAQDTALYGEDIYGTKKLPELLKKISATGAKWIRLMYVYPEHITPKLLSAIAEVDNVCKYVDMPIQHCEEKILKSMGRGSGKYELTNLIRVMRETIPGIYIRTTLMVGFPGETAQDFNCLCDFVEEVRFDRMGVFPYSPEEGTPAAVMTNQVKESTKKTRYKKLMQLQQKIHFEKQKSLVGTVLEVIIDDFIPDEGCYVGRPYFDAPETDSVVYFSSDVNLSPGNFCHVLVMESENYDLRGQKNEPPQ